MLPPYMEVCRNPATGAFILDEHGRVQARFLTEQPVMLEDPLPTEDRSSPSVVPAPAPASPGAGSMMDTGGASDEEVASALELSEAVPGSMKFFTVKDVSLSANADQDIRSGTFKECERFQSC